jgi:hypothetical protein
MPAITASWNQNDMYQHWHASPLLPMENQIEKVRDYTGASFAQRHGSRPQYCTVLYSPNPSRAPHRQADESEMILASGSSHWHHVDHSINISNLVATQASKHASKAPKALLSAATSRLVVTAGRADSSTASASATGTVYCNYCSHIGDIAYSIIQECISRCTIMIMAAELSTPVQCSDSVHS